MWQVKANLAWLVTDSGTNSFSISSEYKEPGFTQFYPLIMSIRKCDRFQLLFKKRSGATINISNMIVSVVDSTNNQNIPNSLSTISTTVISLYVTNALNLSTLPTRVRTIDIYLKDITDDTFIKFRVVVDDDEQMFHYIHVNSSHSHERQKLSSKSRNAYIKLNSDSDSYVVFSPYASIKEVDSTSTLSTFSYPMDTIFYKRQNVYSNEGFSYSISSTSHSFVDNLISVMSVPYYGKSGVLLIDRKMYKDIEDNMANVYVDISVVGDISQISDTFRINFTI